MSQSPTRDASTVVLLRPSLDTTPEAFQVFFVKRHRKSGFFANAYVFPGGKLDPADCDPALHERVAGVSAAEASRLLGSGVPPETALGLYVAALRETFEEAGVLLAVDAHRRPLDFGDPDLRRRYEGLRAELQRGSTGMLRILAGEGILLDVGSLRPWSRWVTPEIEPKRYDTRFFVAVHPDDQEALHDQLETTDSEWLSPSEALRAYAEGRIQLAPPTIRTLEELSDHRTVDAVIAAAARRRDLPRIMPVPVSHGGGLTLLLPDDGRYPGTEAPQHARSCFEMLDGKWKSLRP